MRLSTLPLQHYHANDVTLPSQTLSNIENRIRKGDDFHLIIFFPAKRKNLTQFETPVKEFFI